MDQESNKHQLGNYILGQTLGKGTFGKVYLATHSITQELVAIKVLDKSKIEQQDDRERIIRQIEILRIVRHPNICQLYQVLQNKNYIYLVTQYCEEGQLLSYISKRKRLKQSRASRFINQILNALIYLKNLGIVHRDLKPQNILLDFDFNVKLIDFGLSNYSKGQLLETACGSPCYASPQMISGNPYDGYSSDVWSLGVILFVMVCGELPFQQKTTKQLYAKISIGNYKRIPDYLRKQTVNLIKSLLIVNPQHRLNLNCIRHHSFCQWTKQLQPLIKGIVVGKHAMPIDLQLLQQVKQKLEFQLNQGQDCIRCNKHNTISTTYYLMQKKVLRDGGKTVLELQYYLQSLQPVPKQSSKIQPNIKITQRQPSSARVRNRSRSIQQTIRKVKLKQRAIQRYVGKTQQYKNKFKFKNDTSTRIKTQGNQQTLRPSFPNRKNDKTINILHRIMPNSARKKQSDFTPTKKRILQLTLQKGRSCSIQKKQQIPTRGINFQKNQQSPPSSSHKKRGDVSIVGAAKVQIRINKPIFINR